MAEVGFELARAAWLFAPLLLAAVLAGVVQRQGWLRFAAVPIDGGRCWRGRRVFGDGKTWRGVLLAVGGSGLGAWVQWVTGLEEGSGGGNGVFGVVDWGRVPAVLFGAAMGLGAAVGELPNSFVKRRAGIAPGTTAAGWRAVVFFVWDQVDLVLGAWVAIAWWVPVEVGLVLASLVLALVAHPVVSVIGWLAGARKSAR